MNTMYRTTIFLLLLATLLAGCTTAPAQPGQVKRMQVDGREVYYYIPGYSIEDFLCEFDGAAECRSEYLTTHNDVTGRFHRAD